MSDQNKSKYWLDQLIDQILAENRDEPLVVQSGHSPSGTYHIGLIREFVISNAIAGELNRTGHQAKYIDFIDNFDVLRKLPAGIDQTFESEIGKPLFKASDPYGCHSSYGDHFLADLRKASSELGLSREEELASEHYAAGDLTKYIEITLSKLDEIKDIITRVSNRQLEAGWAPVQLLSDSDDLREWTYDGWDENETIFYSDKGGKRGELNFVQNPARVKLNWRIDWPARWHLLNVAVEPFGRDHASKGGSYDTGKEIVERIFGGKAPVPVPYEFIIPSGMTKKFSKSEGGVLTPLDALDIMPPEILKYFVLKPLPRKQLEFDSGMGLYRLIDEYSRVEEAVQDGAEHEFKRAYQVSASGVSEPTIARVSFNHLVTAYQTARGDKDEIKALLRRSGYEEVVSQQGNQLDREIGYVGHWLQKYASEDIKFSIAEQIPNVDLTDEQRGFLTILAAAIEQNSEIDGQKMHELIYAAKDQAGIDASEAFQAIYRVILGQDSGPKAGWFLAGLDRDWLISRLHLRA
jgi:lysyl-tRNA synthetase class 1